MPITPYVVGQWVRGDRFYGRDALLRRILQGNRSSLWLLGTRRVGKTSILKQLEHLTSRSPEMGYFPLFWDFQGAEEVEDLQEGFVDAVLDAADRLEALGVDPAGVEDEDLFASIGHLRRALRRHGRTMLLLGDEAEELVAIHAKAPRFLARLRRALQATEGIRTVLASTIRLWKLATEEASTSPFLNGFTPALAVGRLLDEDARALVSQSRLERESRPRIADEELEAVLERCDNHPYLLQLLGERYLEKGDLDRAIEEIAVDQMVGFFFDSDAAMLTREERRLLHTLASREVAVQGDVLRRELALGSESTQSSLYRLELLGLVKNTPELGYSVPNYFFRRWLREREAPERPAARPAPMPDGESEPAVIDDRYELLESLGNGSSGRVYRAHDRMLETVVALKLLKREYSIEEDAVERVRREVVLARNLSHPNVLKIYHLGEDRGRRYVTMEYVAGTDLARVLANGGRLTVETAVTIGAKLASALAALHRCDVLHRDIKPSNILIDEAGEPHISDFGLARLPWGASVTRDGRFVGTPAYASPEQAFGNPLDQRSDLYALGVVLFEMTTGRRPFAARSQRDWLEMHARATPRAPRDLAPEVPDALSRLVLRCLEKKPAARFQSALELHGALEAVGGSLV